jgi:hypothetical protein
VLMGRGSVQRLSVSTRSLLSHTGRRADCERWLGLMRMVPVWRRSTVMLMLDLLFSVDILPRDIADSVSYAPKGRLRCTLNTQA